MLVSIIVNMGSVVEAVDSHMADHPRLIPDVAHISREELALMCYKTSLSTLQCISC